VCKLLPRRYIQCVCVLLVSQLSLGRFRVANMVGEATTASPAHTHTPNSPPSSAKKKKKMASPIIKNPLPLPNTAGANKPQSTNNPAGGQKRKMISSKSTAAAAGLRHMIAEFDNASSSSDSSDSDSDSSDSGSDCSDVSSDSSASSSEDEEDEEVVPASKKARVEQPATAAKAARPATTVASFAAASTAVPGSFPTEIKARTQAIKNYATRMLAQTGAAEQGWSFGWDRAARRAAKIQGGDSRWITFSWKWVKAAPDADIRNLIIQYADRFACCVSWCAESVAASSFAEQLLESAALPSREITSSSVFADPTSFSRMASDGQTTSLQTTAVSSVVARSHWIPLVPLVSSPSKQRGATTTQSAIWRFPFQRSQVRTCAPWHECHWPKRQA
jgi:hypothetical protein